MTNLRMTHHALSMYQVDWLGYPPFDVDEAQRHAGGVPVLSPAPAIQQNIPMWDTNGDGTGDLAAHPTGLWILSEVTHNLNSPKDFHCPEAYEVYSHDGTNPVLKSDVDGTKIRVYDGWYQSWFYCSYQNYDPDGNSWEYLPVRDRTVTSGPDYRRQLWDARLSAPMPGGDMGCSGLQRYQPSGETVVTWCPHHREENRDENRLENSLVLFADGSVEIKQRFVDWVAAGNPAWTFPRNDPNWW